MTVREYIFFVVASLAVIYSIAKDKPEKEIEFITLETTCVCETFDQALLSKAVKEKNIDDLCPIWAEENEYTYIDELYDVCVEMQSDTSDSYPDY